MKKTIVAFIGSGGGSTGASAIDAFLRGEMPNVRRVAAFISTVPGAGLLAKAEERGIPNFVIDDSQPKVDFQKDVADLHRSGIHLLVSAGCRRALPEIEGVCVINTHPQDKEEHGGQDMVSLEPHLHFLEYEIMDKLRRGRASMKDTFYAKLTSHYCHGRPDIISVSPYDCGATIMQVPIPISQDLIKRAWEIRHPCKKDGKFVWEREIERRLKMDDLAKEIQNHVLIYERELLPRFVDHVAWQIGQALVDE